MPGVAVIFHTVSHLSAALAVAEQTGKPITLLTPPGGAGYAGAGFYRRLLDRGFSAHPDARFRCLLDCGSDAALALQALREGWTDIVFSGPAPASTKIENVATGLGARVHPQPPSAIDLLSAEDAETACRQALTGGHV